MNKTGKALVKFGIEMAVGFTTYYGTMELLQDNDKSERETFKKFFSKLMISEASALMAMQVTDASIQGFGMVYKALTK